MKAKEKKELFKSVCNNVNPNDEAVFVLYSRLNDGNLYIKGDMELVRKGLKGVLARGIAGKEDAPNTVIAWAILGALRELQDEGIDINELLSAFDEDDEEPDDCLDCELFGKCQSERAKAWRTILETN